MHESQSVLLPECFCLCVSTLGRILKFDWAMTPSSTTALFYIWELSSTLIHCWLDQGLQSNYHGRWISWGKLPCSREDKYLLTFHQAVWKQCALSSPHFHSPWGGAWWSGLWRPPPSWRCRPSPSACRPSGGRSHWCPGWPGSGLRNIEEGRNSAKAQHILTAFYSSNGKK